MKTVKRSITLPLDLYQYADKRAGQLAEERGSVKNFSAVMAELLVDAKRARKPRKRAA
jgi:hypothetical protein